MLYLIAFVLFTQHKYINKIYFKNNRHKEGEKTPLNVLDLSN